MLKRIATRPIVFMAMLCCAGIDNAVAQNAELHPITNAVPYVAKPVPLSAVRLTGGPLKTAQDLDIKYLLDLEPDRMLAHLRARAGLEPKAQGYGGWDGAGRQLTGHIAGHYLSAVSLMYAATGDARFKERADYIVSQLKEIQDKHGDGYIGALMGNQGPRGNQTVVDGKPLFAALATGTINSGGFDLNGMWSPWYVQHKIYAGLRDAYRLTGNRTALDVEIKFAEWADSILSKLDEAQIQKMLATEFGGMNEIMIDLYADTGDQRWLKAYRYFDHHAIVDPLAKKQDILGGKHGNTQVPKMLGELTRYIYTGNESSGVASKFFWEQVVYHHSFATGGHGYDEYFGPADKLSGQIDGTGQRSNDLRTAESCNVYNMLKMTRQLFSIDPDARYVEFLERGLFNHVLASINLNDGRTCYMVPVGQNVQHEYQNMMQSFTCCVGSGMESHAIHGDGIYSENGNRLWVNLFVPSTLDWKSQGVTLAMETDFPVGDAASIKITSGPEKEWTMLLRRPAWAGDGFALSVNGQAVADLPKPGTYATIKRIWKNGDVAKMILPKAIHSEVLPDNPNRMAMMWGPLVLAGDLGASTGRGGGGRGRGTPAAQFPAFAAVNPSAAELLRPIEGQAGAFTAKRAGPDGAAVTLQPFYQLSGHRYGIYWDVFTQDEWAKRSAGYEQAQAQQQKLAAATVAYAQPGQMQPERDFNFQGEEATVVQLLNQPARRSAKWFSFDLPVDPTHPMAIVVTYTTDEPQPRKFDIQVDGKSVKMETISRSTPAKLVDMEYAIPAELVKEKQKVTVRFQAAEGSEIAAVFGIRMIRADLPR